MQIEIPEETWQRIQALAERAHQTPVEFISATFRGLADQALLDERPLNPGGGRFLDPRLSGGPGAKD